MFIESHLSCSGLYKVYQLSKVAGGKGYVCLIYFSVKAYECPNYVVEIFV